MRSGAGRVARNFFLLLAKADRRGGQPAGSAPRRRRRHAINAPDQRGRPHL